RRDTTSRCTSSRTRRILCSTGAASRRSCFRPSPPGSEHTASAKGPGPVSGTRSLPVSAKFLSHVRACPIALPERPLLPLSCSKWKSCPTVFARQPPMLHGAPVASWSPRLGRNRLPLHLRCVHAGARGAVQLCAVVVGALRRLDVLGLADPRL